MKKLLFTLILSGSMLFSNAQITITQNDMPSANDTIRYSNAATNSVTFVPSNTGANYNWNFSNLIPVSQGLYEYKNSINTPYFFYFIGKIGLKTADSLGVSTIQLTDIYSFYTKSSTVFKTEGLGYSYSNIPLSNNYLDEDEIYQFPLQFGDHDSSTYYFDYDLSAYTTYIDYAQNGSRVNTVDGWGIITTPYTTYNNVLRVKTQIYAHDTITVLGFPIVTNRTTVEYKWLSNTEKIPVLEISGTENGTNYTITSIKYRDYYFNITGIENNLYKSGTFSIYPNPATDKITVDISSIQGNNNIVSIYNAMGQLIIQQPLQQPKSEIDISKSEKGVYLLKLSSNDNTVVTRIVKE